VGRYSYEETEKGKRGGREARRGRSTARRRCVSLLAPANCRGQPALAEELTELSRTPRRQARRQAGRQAGRQARQAGKQADRQAGRQAGNRAGIRHFGSANSAWPRVASASVDARSPRRQAAARVGCRTDRISSAYQRDTAGHRKTEC
jgi:hypothetical protein